MNSRDHVSLAAMFHQSASSLAKLCLFVHCDLDFVNAPLNYRHLPHCPKPPHYTRWRQSAAQRHPSPAPGHDTPSRKPPEPPSPPSPKPRVPSPANSAEAQVIYPTTTRICSRAAARAKTRRQHTPTLHMIARTTEAAARQERRPIFPISASTVAIRMRLPIECFSILLLVPWVPLRLWVLRPLYKVRCTYAYEA